MHQNRGIINYDNKTISILGIPLGPELATFDRDFSERLNTVQENQNIHIQIIHTEKSLVECRKEQIEKSNSYSTSECKESKIQRDDCVMPYVDNIANCRVRRDINDCISINRDQKSLDYREKISANNNNKTEHLIENKSEELNKKLTNETKNESLFLNELFVVDENEKSKKYVRNCVYTESPVKEDDTIISINCAQNEKQIHNNRYEELSTHDDGNESDINYEYLHKDFDVKNEDSIFTPNGILDSAQAFSEEFRSLARRLTSLDRDRAEAISNLVLKYKNVFSAQPGLTSIYEHKIKLIKSKPISNHSYPVPIHLRDLVRQEIKTMCDAGIIERGSGPYCNPLRIVDKKDGRVRVCLDARYLNAIIEGTTNLRR